MFVPQLRLACPWLLGFLLLSGALYRVTEHELARDEQATRDLALKQAESLADSYANQLEHLAEQIDRLSLGVTYTWQDAPQSVDLVRDRRRGLFPNRHEFFMFIIDERGDVVRTSHEAQRKFNFSDSPFFKSHQARCCNGLLVSPPEFSPLAGKSIVRFSRRLDHRDGSFAGVVVVAVEPEFLVTFQDEALQGPQDFVTARLASGAFVATRLGNGNHQKRVFYKNGPVFDSRRAARLEPGDRFQDGKARYVAWHKLDTYSLVAMAGLTEAGALASFDAMARSYRRNAWLAMAFLFGLGVTGFVVSSHITARRRAEDDVRRTYRMATDAANEGFYMLRPSWDDAGVMVDFQIEDCNERAAALLGSLREHLVGRRASETLSEELRTELLGICRRALEAGIYEDEQRLPAHGWINASWIYRRAVHSGSGIALTLRDISEAKLHEQALSEMANSDALTRLPNRRWLTNFLPAAMRRAERGHGKLALLFIDLDNFKEVNDTLGHQVGDALLVQAAARLRETVRSSDHVVRLGGDEFTIVLENADARNDVARIAASVVARLSEPYPAATSGEHHVSASVGISVYPDDGSDADSLLKHADVAMYAAKAAGKGRYHFYDPALSEVLMRRLSSERALRQAIENDEFLLHYQPRVNAITGELCSVEALLRWVPPDGRLRLPAEFLAVAEDAGLIVPISEAVIEKVAAQLAQWQARGMPLVPVSINISAGQLQHGRTAACIRDALTRHQVDARLIEIEVTESTVVDRSIATTRELDALRALGLRLMIDDFGTGYSSLAQLHRLDVDVLKVDQAFTQALFQGAEGEQLYRAIVSMAAALDMRVVAEGVETVEQLKLLQAIGCDEIQGYVISEAVPADELERKVHVGFPSPDMPLSTYRSKYVDAADQAAVMVRR